MWMHRLQSSLFCSAVVALVGVSGCAEATGTVQGGESLLDTGDGGDGGTTWSALYADFFGPSGTAGCSSQGSCHGTASESGAQTSGFVCGASKLACWQGIAQGIPADAGGIFPPIAQSSGDPTQTQLEIALHKSAASGLNNMPCGTPPDCPASDSTYTFTSDDIARITTWIQQGAQNN